MNSYETIKLSTGELVQVYRDGTIGMCFDRNGSATTPDFSPGAARELRRKAMEQLREGEHERAVYTMENDPRYADAADLLRQLPEDVARQADMDAATFNRLHAQARQQVGPSDVELQAAEDRKEKIKALEQYVREAKARPEGKDVTSALAQIMELKGVTE